MCAPVIYAGYVVFLLFVYFYPIYLTDTSLICFFCAWYLQQGVVPKLLVFHTGNIRVKLVIVKHCKLECNSSGPEGTDACVYIVKWWHVFYLISWRQTLVIINLLNFIKAIFLWPPMPSDSSYRSACFADTFYSNTYMYNSSKVWYYTSTFPGHCIGLQIKQKGLSLYIILHSP